MRLKTLGYVLLTLLTPTVVHAQLPVMDGLEAWFDATDISTLYTNEFFEEQAVAGGPVGGWRDKSENEWEMWGVLDANSDEKFPVLDETAMNGQPALRFTGSNAEGMIFEDDFFLDREYTAFIVNKYWGDVQGRTLQSTEINWLMGLWAGRTGHFAEGWVTPQDRAQKDAVYLGEAIGREDSSSFILNGVDITNNEAPVGIPGRLGLVGGWESGGFPGEVSDADVSEIVLYNRVLSDSERESVRGYLDDKYEIGGPPPPPVRIMTVKFGEAGGYTGGDPGEGLDFEGDFAYAVNVGGQEESPDFEPLVVGDAVFTDGSEEIGTDGVFITDANQINPWGTTPEFGDSDNDNNLEIVSNSIRWNGAGEQALEINVDVEEGQAYKLQLLFHEQCCDRGWDISVEGELAVDNFNPAFGGVEVEGGPEYVLQDGIANLERGAFFSHEFVAGDDELNLVFGGSDPVAPDNNPILDGFTLERIDGVVTPGDCNGDGVVDADDLDCVSTTDERDIVLNALNTLPGDLDGDGKVAFGDFTVLSANFGDAEKTKYTDGDIDLMKGPQFADFTVLSANFGKSPEGAAAVPEPATAFLAGLGLLSLLAIRRRR